MPIAGQKVAPRPRQSNRGAAGDDEAEAKEAEAADDRRGADGNCQHAGIRRGVAGDLRPFEPDDHRKRGPRRSRSPGRRTRLRKARVPQAARPRRS